MSWKLYFAPVTSPGEERYDTYASEEDALKAARRLDWTCIVVRIEGPAKTLSAADVKRWIRAKNLRLFLIYLGCAVIAAAFALWGLFSLAARMFGNG